MGLCVSAQHCVLMSLWLLGHTCVALRSWLCEGLCMCVCAQAMCARKSVLLQVGVTGSLVHAEGGVCVQLGLSSRLMHLELRVMG